MVLLWSPSWNQIHRIIVFLIKNNSIIINVQFAFNEANTHIVTEKFYKIHFHIELYVKLCSVMATILDFQSTTKMKFVEDNPRNIWVIVNFKWFSCFREESAKIFFPLGPMLILERIQLFFLELFPFDTGSLNCLCLKFWQLIFVVRRKYMYVGMLPRDNTC